jgi:uncharacterized Zn finger protein
MLIPLICKQCGGRLEVEQSQVIESGDNVIVFNGQTFKCPHCGVQYLSGEKIRHIPRVSVGSISVGGNVGGQIIIGDGIIVNTKPQQATPSEIHATQEFQRNNPQMEVKTHKKWWEFWKK